MPSLSAPTTTKSEFTRWLDDHEDRIPSLKKHSIAYRRDNPNRHTFGMWLHARHLDEFQRAYTGWWLKHPELFGSVYEEATA